jgi:hypothetical protein
MPHHEWVGWPYCALLAGVGVSGGIGVRVSPVVASPQLAAADMRVDGRQRGECHVSDAGQGPAP